jgi:secreted PhoX family phosphatase
VAGKVVLLGTDDNGPAAFGSSLRSELYMYVADDAAGVLDGTGKLYVFKAGLTNSGQLAAGAPITGSFVEVPGAGALSADALQTAVDGLGAFKFVRLEDLDYDRHPGLPGSKPSIYFVDTGNINGRCGADACDLFGSIYRIDLDAGDPTQNARLVLLARSRGVAAGDWASPDNIAVSGQSLMLQEDPAYAEFNRPERIWNFTLREDGNLGAPRAVVELENKKFTGNVCVDAASTCWESSGIIDASRWLGDGTWLFDIQAHTLPFTYQDGSTTVSLSKEGGQLLYLRLPGS